MNYTVGMISLGCSKNQVDAERLCALLINGGFVISPDQNLCDVIIVNTCGFIEDAKKESIDSILELISLKQTGKLKVIAVTGCLAERYRDEILKEIPEVDVVLGIGGNDFIADTLRRALDGEKVTLYGDKHNLSLSGERLLTGAGYSAYLKVADGCDNNCSYCAIPLIRGSFRSRTVEDILEEATFLVSKGISELNVIAQDTTRYGLDIYGEFMLPTLLEKLCGINGIHWIRILYCYPENITDRLLETIAAEPKILNYFDIPVQHSSGKILGAMNRRGDEKSLAALFEKIRTKIPDAVLRTTLITGFPGESEADFENLQQFIGDIRFDRLGCFAYSQEEDTPAALFSEQLEGEKKSRRADNIMELQQQIAFLKATQQIGRTLEVLCEGFDDELELFYGRSYMDAPDVDPKVFFADSKKPHAGEYRLVKITDSNDYDLIGIAL